MTAPAVDATLPQLTYLLRVQSIRVESLEGEQRKLQSLQEAVRKEKCSQLQLKQDICKVEQQSRVLQEKGVELRSGCGKAGSHLEALVTSTLRLQHLSEQLQQEREDQKSLCAQYRNKMAAHIHKAGQLDQPTIFMELQDKIAKEKEHRASVYSLLGDVAMETANGTRLEQTRLLTESKLLERDRIVKENSDWSIEIYRLKKIISDMKQEMMVAKKRSHAQLIRLRHQLQEAQHKRCHYIKEKEQLIFAMEKINQMTEE